MFEEEVYEKVNSEITDDFQGVRFKDDKYGESKFIESINEPIGNQNLENPKDIQMVQKDHDPKLFKSDQNSKPSLSQVDSDIVILELQVLLDGIQVDLDLLTLLFHIYS